MSVFSALKQLNLRHQAIIALSVLLDGREAENYLKCDKQNGAELSKFAADLSKNNPEIRMPLAGSILRQALEEMGQIK
jgi:hypothetical protein